MRDDQEPICESTGYDRWAEVDDEKAKEFGNNIQEGK